MSDEQMLVRARVEGDSPGWRANMMWKCVCHTFRCREKCEIFVHRLRV